MAVIAVVVVIVKMNSNHEGKTAGFFQALPATGGNLNFYREFENFEFTNSFQNEHQKTRWNRSFKP
jgi:hypothetical protein